MDGTIRELAMMIRCDHVKNNSINSVYNEQEAAQLKRSTRSVKEDQLYLDRQCRKTSPETVGVQP